MDCTGAQEYRSATSAGSSTRRRGPRLCPALHVAGRLDHSHGSAGIGVRRTCVPGELRILGRVAECAICPRPRGDRHRLCWHPRRLRARRSACLCRDLPDVAARCDDPHRRHRSRRPHQRGLAGGSGIEHHSTTFSQKRSAQPMGVCPDSVGHRDRLWPDGGLFPVVFLGDRHFSVSR